MHGPVEGRLNACGHLAPVRVGSLPIGELRADIDGVSAKMLSARLRELVGKGVVIRQVLPHLAALGGI